MDLRGDSDHGPGRGPILTRRSRSGQRMTYGDPICGELRTACPSPSRARVLAPWNYNLYRSLHRVDDFEGEEGGQLHPDMTASCNDRKKRDFVKTELEPTLMEWISHRETDDVDLVVTWTLGKWRIGARKNRRAVFFSCRSSDYLSVNDVYLNVTGWDTFFRRVTNPSRSLTLFLPAP